MGKMKDIFMQERQALTFKTDMYFDRETGQYEYLYKVAETILQNNCPNEIYTKEKVIKAMKQYKFNQ